MSKTRQERQERRREWYTMVGVTALGVLLFVAGVAVSAAFAAAAW